MSSYVIFYANGGVLDKYRSPHQDEQDFIDQHAADGASQIIRRQDGVIVYEKKEAK